MLYIKSLSDYTVEFGDGDTHSQTYAKDLVATSDELDRIWIQNKYKHEKVLNSCPVSQISLWDEDNSVYVVYPDAEQFVINFNLVMNNQTMIPVEVTTTTTTIA